MTNPKGLNESVATLGMRNVERFQHVRQVVCRVPCAPSRGVPGACSATFVQAITGRVNYVRAAVQAGATGIA